ncbi:Zn(II)2Cys6 transcription factor [Aspergillus novofumigatus IBT 16806]|uniref:Putative C6 finger domain protein n=1 Tax=Aspergillus novofumigatus (strain IBT 16806) TaxID=1392255 RepID=A0A2I1CIY9_ASPN1|nr:putative C6 finger domain protein [Aspergillus novofumigatus IBT 16806]PKX97593.1 putative C6 finger domain protein [Aspergillus novofumigatus IBT 16806]
MPVEQGQPTYYGGKPPAPPRARGLGRSGPRRRSGCLTCRARKVRCDEAKPICANCTRLRLGCVYKTIVPAAVPRQANGRAAAVTGNQTANTFQRPDASYFSTVLRPDGQQAYQAPHAADASQLRSVDNAATSPGPFDMLGFMSEITSELERKHLDLTNGLSEFTNATSCKTSDDTTNVPHTDRSMSWDSSVYSKGTQSQSPATEGMWPETGAAYEEHLMAYFLSSEPPATIFGPVNLEWKYVREVIVAQSRDFRPLRNSIYCFVEVHKAIKEGSQPNSASTYHQQASLEGQSYIFGHVDEPTLMKVFTTVFLLMLSESLSSPELSRNGTSFLHSAYLLLQRFHDQIQSWTGFGRLVVSWVSLLDVKSLIAGRDGDPLIELGSLAELSTAQNESSGGLSGQSPISSGIMDDPPVDKKVTEDYLLSKPGYLVYDAIVGPAFRFFVQAQQIIRRIVCIDLHHRSRGTLGDEFEVLQIAHRVGADLETLWNCRPPVLDVYDRPEELLDSLSQSVADEVCRTFRQYVANFLAIFIYLHRVAFAIYPRTDRVNRAVDQIIQLATAESASTQRHLPVSFFWPLFIAGLEGTLTQRRWIMQEMQRMVACDSDVTQRHPNASKVLYLLEEMTRRQDASRTWADSRCVRRELFTDFYVLI